MIVDPTNARRRAVDFLADAFESRFFTLRQARPAASDPNAHHLRRTGAAGPAVEDVVADEGAA